MHDEPRPPRLSERDLEMAHEIGRVAGQHVVARAIELAQDDEFVNRVTDKWVGKAQMMVGGAVIKFLIWVFGLVTLIAAWKAGLVAAITDAVSSSK